jgi:excisionase family DNA binding protein
LDQELLTVIEAAKMLRLQDSTIRAWIWKRKMPFVRLGRRVFVRKADCDALIRANTIMPEGAAAQKFSQLSSA